MSFGLACCCRTHAFITQSPLRQVVACVPRVCLKLSTLVSRDFSYKYNSKNKWKLQSETTQTRNIRYATGKFRLATQLEAQPACFAKLLVSFVIDNDAEISVI